MKKTLLLTPFLLLTSICFAQKHLPKEVVIKMSDREYIDFYRKIDSITNILATTSNAPSSFVTPFLQRFGIAWMTIDQRVAKQMIADSTKTSLPKKKTN